MHTLRAVRLTIEAARRLRLARGPGRVHSAFARTVNVELEGLGDWGWLSVHGPGPIPAPFGIACVAVPPWEELAGVTVRIEADAVIFDGSLRVTVDGAERGETTLPPVAPLPEDEGLSSAAGAGAAGLLPVALAILAGGAPPVDPLGRMAAPVLARLYAATRVADAIASGAAASALLGLGPGLTPAGDDCLVGWLAGARAAGPRGRQLVELSGPGLLAVAAGRTGALSRAFLAAAVRGQVAEPVRAYVERPDRERLAGVLDLGATSGADLLAGYLLARAALTSRSRR